VLESETEAFDLRWKLAPLNNFGSLT